MDELVTEVLGEALDFGQSIGRHGTVALGGFRLGVGLGGGFVGILAIEFIEIRSGRGAGGSWRCPPVEPAQDAFGRE